MTASLCLHNTKLSYLDEWYQGESIQSRSQFGRILLDFDNPVRDSVVKNGIWSGDFLYEKFEDSARSLGTSNKGSKGDSKFLSL